MKKIIHLSDLHIGHEDMSERFAHIIKMIEFFKPEAENYIIVITGDLVERATKSNYSEAKELIDYFRKWKYTVLPVPGNHDYAELIFHFKKNVKLFKKTFFEKDDDFFKIYDGEYPKIDVFGDKKEEKIAFIGLDSMADELHWYDSMWANGEIGPKQLERLDKRLREKKVIGCPHKVIYLHHHPFEPLNPSHLLKDADKFLERIRKYIEEDEVNHEISAILYGHNHFCNNINGKLGIHRCYDAGTSTRKLNNVSQHRVIDLSGSARLDYDGDFLRGYCLT